jgi:hypothetical protein
MTRPLHIIASCTDRKRGQIPVALRLRSVRESDIEARARAWWKRLQEEDHATVMAEDLYAGDHWHVVRELPGVAEAAGYKPCLWVASAGYGLIRAESPVRPYSATFTRGHEDSVVRAEGQGLSATEVSQRWWKALGAHGGSTRALRSIHQVAAAEPRSSILVVASPSYVAALSEDLGLAAKTLDQPENLLIISGPSASLEAGELAPHWIPSNAYLQARMGGSRISLHARVARDILEEAKGHPLNAAKSRAHYQRIIQNSPPPRRYDRKPMTDDEVRAFINQVVGEGVKSWSAGLRLLRSREQACEQSRFRRIFQEMRERS